jgi:hypothetical protein
MASEQLMTQEKAVSWIQLTDLSGSGFGTFCPDKERLYWL